MKIEIVYPNAHFLYQHSESLEYGLFVNVDGSISNVSAENTNSRYVRFFQVLVAPTTSFRISGKLFGHVRTGLSLGQRLEMRDEDFDVIRDWSSEPQWFTRLGVSLRLNQ